MGPREEYLLRAAELSAMAQIEPDLADKVEFENLERAYLRLAEQAERNNQGYKTAPNGSRPSSAASPEND